MMAGARSLNVDGLSCYWRPIRGGVAVQLGESTSQVVRVLTEYRHPDRYCFDGCCADSTPPGVTPGLARKLARRLFGDGLTKGSVIDDIWVVHHVDDQRTFDD